MGMGTETIIVFAVCGLILLIIIISSWYRRRKDAAAAAAAKAAEEPSSVSRIHETVIDGQRAFRIATVSRQSGQLSLDVYEIRLPRPNDPTGTATITLLPPPSRSRDSRRAITPPPPPFSTAVHMPSPSDSSLLPNSAGSLEPPRYDEVITISTISGAKLSSISEELREHQHPEEYGRAPPQIVVSQAE